MSTDRRDLVSLVEKLRQEQEFSLFYKTQIRQTIQNINRCCDRVFQTLWLTQCLGCGLDRTKMNHLQGVEWTWVLEQASYVEFVDAAKFFRSSSLVENYNKFLGALLDSPALLARVLVWAESEGRDSASLINDLISVVYGHCVFQRDHTLFLRLLKELLSHLISSAVSPKDLFSGVEPIFCRVLTEYCNQLVDLQVFLVQAFEEPLAEVFTFNDYLEFDVNKAGTRYQSLTENPSGGSLLDGSDFLFGEDLDNSCGHLARLAMHFVEVIRCHTNHFPASLKWVLGSLKSLVRAKWPEVSAIELRRPVSSVLFGPILGSIIVNPDSHGLCDMQVVVSPIARYNLSQVASVLQGCAWVLERQGGKYPIQKVIKKMNTKSYCDLLNSLDGEYSGEIPELPSSLPGLKRTVKLTSQAQLNNLVGLVCEVATDLTRKTDSSPETSVLCKLETQLPQSIRQMATSVPYLPPTLAPRAQTMKPQSLRVSDAIDAAQGGKTSARKRVSADVKSPVKPNKKRSSSTSNLNQVLVGGVSSSSTRTATRSISPNQMLYTHSESYVRSTPRGRNSLGNFQVPSKVLILPVCKDGSGPSVSAHTSLVTQWDFTLLSEDEVYNFMQKAPSLKKTDPISPSFQHSSAPHTEHTSTPSSTQTTTTIPTSPPDITMATQTQIQNRPTHVPDVTDGLEPRHITDGLQNGMESGSNSTNSVRSPVRKLWDRRLSKSRTGSGSRQLASAGSDSSVNTCMSSREPSSSPQTVPKKRSFTVTSIEKGKFALNVNLSPLRHRANANPFTSPLSPPPHSPSPTPAITTTPPPLPPPAAPPVTSPPPHLANGVANSPSPPMSPNHPPLTSSSTHSSDSRSVGPHCTSSPIKDHLNTSWQSNQDRLINHPNHELSPSNPDLSASDLDRPSSDAETPAAGSSIENLVDDDQLGTPKSRGKDGKKKKWLRLKRKKKDKKTKSQLSLQEESKTVEIMSNKQRSKSDFHILDDPSKQDNVKPRSSTNNALESQKVDDDLKNSPRAVFKKRRSYTILDKYYALVMEQKKREAPLTAMPEKAESLPRFVSQCVEEMDPETFRQSLFCNQLEFKLRAALQNVHTPLTWSHTHCQLNSNCDFRSQLITLLQCALQRSKWIHDDMETALLTETLTMVNRLPNSLVGVAVECAHTEQEKRKTYTSYLVQSHVKFLDVRLQVGALQSAIDRRQEMLKEQFVLFAVRQFLDTQGDQLAELDHSMTSLFLADERCSLMKKRVEVFTETLLEDQTWEYWPRENSEMVSKYLEDQLFSLVYPHVFQPNMEVDQDKDKIFSSHLSSLAEVLTPTHKSLQISPIYHSGCPWLSAQKHLKNMSLFKSPRGKVHCIVESCRVLISLLQYAKVGSPPGADDLFPVLVYVLIKANPPALLSTTQYIRNFLEDELIGEESYWWVQFSTAVEFTKTLE